MSEFITNFLTALVITFWAIILIILSPIIITAMIIAAFVESFKNNK